MLIITFFKWVSNKGLARVEGAVKKGALRCAKCMLLMPAIKNYQLNKTYYYLFLSVELLCPLRA